MKNDEKKEKKFLGASGDRDEVIKMLTQIAKANPGLTIEEYLNRYNNNKMVLS